MEKGFEGFEKVMKNLNEEISGIKGRTQKGLIRAGLKIRRESMKNAPVVTGNLKASAFTVFGKGVAAGSNPSFEGENASKLATDHASLTSSLQHGGKLEPYVYVGHSAFYTVYVHESPGAGTGTMDPNTPAYKQASEVGTWKFLEKAIRDNEKDIVSLVKKEAEVK